MDYRIAPFRALRFHAKTAGGGADALVAPPYDIISTADHGRLLDRSPHNIVRLTLGETPGAKEDYTVRGQRLLDWKERGVLRVDDAPSLYVYGCDYVVPGTDRRAVFRGLVALGHLHDFAERVVLPHEHTFPDVVDDRFHLLAATRTHLESIFLLYEDPERAIDALLDELSRGEPELAVEAKPGETHSLWRVTDRGAIARLVDLFRPQRPIIADGHHRYTTALQYRARLGSEPGHRAGCEWQPIVFGNLVGDGLSILATHRLVDCGGRAAEALAALRSHLEPAGDDDWTFCVETRDGVERFRVPDEVRASRAGAAASDYGILHEVVLSQWLRPAVSPDRELGVSYFKEGSGEREALERGEGDLLFRMRPVGAGEFRAVVDGGEVFPHKTTFFYPKLWSGLTLWSLEDVEVPGVDSPS